MALSTQYLAEFLGSGTTITVSGTMLVVVDARGIASQAGVQTLSITTSGVLAIASNISQLISITTTGVERVGLFYDGTASIVIFTEGRAKVHEFNVYKDGLQNVRIT